MPSRIFNIIRHSRRANRLFFYWLLAIRPYRFYVFRNLFYVISDLFKYCEQYFRSKRSCELALPDAEIKRLLR